MGAISLSLQQGIQSARWTGSVQGGVRSSPQSTSLLAGDHFVDDAARVPFTPAQQRKYVVDPNHVYEVARRVIASAPEHETEDEFLLRLKIELKIEFPFIDVEAKTYTNRFRKVKVSLIPLFVSTKEYMILCKYEEAPHQESNWSRFLKRVAARGATCEPIPQDVKLGFSGIYQDTEFRTVPVWGPQTTLTENGKLHVHQPGDRAYLAPGEGKFYHCGWILECAHGGLWRSIPRFLWENKLGDIVGQMGALLRGFWNTRGLIRSKS